MRYLFKEFLTDKIVYSICKNYWETKIENLLERKNIKDAKPYLNTKFGNGQDFYNGNPMINYYIKSLNKAIRIVQEEPESDKIELSAWLNKVDFDELKTTELVICMELTPEAETLVFDLIKKWLIDDYSENLMNKYIAYIFENLSVQKSELLEEAEV